MINEHIVLSRKRLRKRRTRHAMNPPKIPVPSSDPTAIVFMQSPLCAEIFRNDTALETLIRDAAAMTLVSSAPFKPSSICSDFWKHSERVCNISWCAAISSLSL